MAKDINFLKAQLGIFQAALECQTQTDEMTFLLRKRISELQKEIDDK